MPNNFCKQALLIGALACSSWMHAQVSEYEHPISIMGQMERCVSVDEAITLSVEDFFVHDVDAAPYSTFKIKIKSGKHYAVDGVCVVPEKGYQGVLEIPVTISDGKFSDKYLYRVTVGDKAQVAVVAKKIYVSPQGDDEAAGTLGAPLRTLDGARRKVLAVKKELQGVGAIEVLFRGGDYASMNTVVFTEKDSGTKEMPVTYKAYPGEDVRFTGSKAIDMSKAGRPSYEIRHRIIDKQASMNVHVVDLKAQGITEYGAIDHVGYGVRNKPMIQAVVYKDGRAWHPARYPNKGNINDVKKALSLRSYKAIGDRVNQWKNTGDLWIDGALTKAWEWQKNRIESIKDGVVTTEWDYYSKIAVQTPKLFYYNMIEELDAPEEYVIDKKAGKLYFYYPAAEKICGEFRISQATVPFVYLKGASYVTFEGVAFEGTRSTAVVMDKGASHNNLVSCVISGTGKDGVSINGMYNEIKHCDIHDIGANGVILSGGDKDNLISACNRIENSRVYDFSQQVRAYNPGITLNGVGQIVSHVELFKGPHMGMKVKGGNHLIQYSDFHDAPCEYSDMLCIYFNTGYSMFDRGTIIRRNKFHNVSGTWKQSAGVYMDNETSGVKVSENYFYDNIAQESGWSVMIHGGADNQILRNTFVYCSFPFCISTRLNGYAADRFAGCLNRWEKEFQTRMNKTWRRHYPELERYFDDEHRKPRRRTYTYRLKKNEKGEILNYWDRRTPDTNVFADNLVYNENQGVLEIGKPNKMREINDGYYVTQSFRRIEGKRVDLLKHSNNHNVMTHPGFVDYTNRNLQIKASSEFVKVLPHVKEDYFGRIGVYPVKK